MRSSIPDIQAQLRLAAEALGAGRLDAARAHCEAAIQADPASIAAMHLRGWIAHSAGRHDEALDWLVQAAERAPNDPAIAYSLGIAMLSGRDAQEAIAQLEHALRLAPNSPEALNAMGVAQERIGRFDAALQAFSRALAVAPGHEKARRNQAQLLHRLGRFPEAAHAYQQLIAAGKATARDLHESALLQARLGQARLAVEQFRAALTMDPSYAPAHCNLGLTLEDLGQHSEAVAALREAKRLAPNLPMIDYHLAAMGALDAPPICPPEYLVQLFDNYAPRFDAHLVAKLGYRGPQLLWEAVAPLRPPGLLDVIDLGCGTGLCGVLFKPMARSLLGVDLSPRMIEQSRARKVYDELVQSDLAPALLARPRQADLILAGDVFIYVGDLRPIFHAVAAALRPGGLFAFTLETTEQANYVLCPSRRYAHNIEYVREVAREQGLIERAISPQILRAGETGPVLGAVAVFSTSSDR